VRPNAKEPAQRGKKWPKLRPAGQPSSWPTAPTRQHFPNGACQDQTAPTDQLPAGELRPVDSLRRFQLRLELETGQRLGPPAGPLFKFIQSAQLETVGHSCSLSEAPNTHPNGLVLLFSSGNFTSCALPAGLLLASCWPLLVFGDAILVSCRFLALPSFHLAFLPPCRLAASLSCSLARRSVSPPLGKLAAGGPPEAGLCPQLGGRLISVATLPVGLGCALAFGAGS